MGKPIFAQLDHDLHNNPKVRKAGRDARDVFVFVLCKNASRGFLGWIPAHYLEADYLADQLGCTEPEAASGVARAIERKLIAVDGDVVSIVGWSSEYGRGPLSNAERQRRYREGKVARDSDDPNHVGGNREENQLSVTNGRYALRSNESNASDQIRSEQNRERERNAKPPVEPATPAPDDAPLRLTPGPAPKVPRKRPEIRIPDGWMPEPVEPPPGVDPAMELEKMRDWALAKDERCVDWQARWRNWLRQATPPRAGSPQAPAPFVRAHRPFPGSRPANEVGRGDPKR